MIALHTSYLSIFNVLYSYSVSLSPTDMVCPTCNRKSADLTHDFCRAHAYCGRDDGSRYDPSECFDCEELWERAEDLAAPDSAQAFQHLKAWVRGFSRNSRPRQPGVDYFMRPEDRRRFQALYAAHASTSSQRSLPDPLAQQVSCIVLLVEFNSYLTF